MNSDGTYVMGYSSIKTQTSPSEIGFASSSDGVNWTPYGENPVITYRSSGWDNAGVGRAMTLVVGKEYYVYYDGQQKDGAFRIGLVKLPMARYPIPEFPSNSLALVASIMLSIALLVLQRKLRARDGLTIVFLPTK